MKVVVPDHLLVADDGVEETGEPVA